MASNRFTLYLRSKADTKPHLVDFTTCLVDYFNFGAESVRVSCEIADNKLILVEGVREAVHHESSNGEVNGKAEIDADDLPKSATNGMSKPSGQLNTSCVLTHPPFCPIKCSSPEELAMLPAKVKERGVGIGVVTVLESSDNNILLTRRADHMRTFPRTWVPPGGHIELGETLLEAALRELHEETGLHLEKVVTSQLLCMWESVFPYIKTMGQPARHHLVVYLLVRVSESSKEMEERMKLDPDEVGAAAWIDANVAKVVATGQLSEDLKNLKITEIVQKEMVQGELPAAVMAAEAPLSGPDIERVSTGTRYAMKHWLLLKGWLDQPQN